MINDGEDYSIIIREETAKRIQYILHRIPYYEVVDLLDELSYGIKHRIQNKYLIDQ